jgi:DNA-binding transcriptional LysR family regulator
MARWDGVEEFIEVVRCGSFTAAAEQLGASKSFISKQIRELETRLNARLINRTTRQLSLTEAGHRFYAKCKEVAELYENAEQEVSQLQDTPVGTLRIAINNTYGVHYMATAVAEYCRLHPLVHVEVTALPVDADLVSDGYDIAIRYGELEDSTQIAKKLGMHSFCLCATPSYFAQYGIPASFEDLRDHNCLVPRSRIWRFNHATGHIKVKVFGTWVSDDGGSLLEASRQGIGIAQLPIHYIERDLLEQHLQLVPGAWARYDRIAWAVLAHNKYITTKVRSFIDFLMDSFIPRLSQSPHMFGAEDVKRRDVQRSD